MQLLEINKENYIGQADPFILESSGRFYIYTTGEDGVYAYSSDELLSGWKFEGKVFTFPDVSEFWAPSVIELDGRFYMYCSFEFYGDTPDKGGHRQTMHVSVADNPLGPFENARQLLHPFSIDSHVVKNESGLFIFYSTNDFDAVRPGTYIAVDRLLDPFTPEGNPHTVVVPTLDEEIYMRDRYKKGTHWHTIEGAFYFREGEWQYVMYSGSCYQNEHYFIGYARAKTDETDLMPYPLLDEIRRLTQTLNLLPRDVLIQLKNGEFGRQYGTDYLKASLKKYYRLYCRNQWKRERFAVGFHIEGDSADPKSFRRFPVLSNQLEAQIAELDTMEQEA